MKFLGRRSEPLAEAAPGDVIPYGGYVPGDGGKVGFARVFDARGGGEEGSRVGVAGVGEEFVDFRFFDDPSGVHDNHAVAVLGDESQVVRDEDGGGSHVFSHVAQEGEDLVLDGDVEGGGRLVGDDEFRFAGEGDGDDDALLHASREGVRVAFGDDFRAGDFDFGEEFQHVAPGFVGCAAAVLHDGFGYLGADGAGGVEGVHRFLEDDAYLPPSQVSQARGGHGENVFPVEEDFSPDDAADRLGQQAYEAHGCDAFAAAAFSDDAQALAASHGEGDVVHGAERPGFGIKGGGEVSDFEERGVRGHGVFSGRGMTMSFSSKLFPSALALRTAFFSCSSIQ